MEARLGCGRAIPSPKDRKTAAQTNQSNVEDIAYLVSSQGVIICHSLLRGLLETPQNWGGGANAAPRLRRVVQLLGCFGLVLESMVATLLVQAVIRRLPSLTLRVRIDAIEVEVLVAASAQRALHPDASAFRLIFTRHRSLN